MILKTKLVLFIILCFVLNGNSQYKALGFSFYGSNYLDAVKDKDYIYEIIYDGILFQFSLNYSNRLSNKISLNNSLGLSIAEGKYVNSQTKIGVGSMEERTYVKKDKRISFLKIGVGGSYWFNSLGKGAFVKSEILLHLLISANSKEEKKVDDLPVIKNSVEFKDQLKSVVPLLKLGIGYNLLLSKKFAVNVALFMDIRMGSYFRESDGFNFLNRGLEFGIGYNLSY